MISAKELSEWAATHEAQSQLPTLVRRAIGQIGSITSITMPAGASVNVGGFDGEVQAEDGNTWVPKGKSYWELSVNSQPRTKAQDDYEKRTRATSKEIRGNSVYIAVTARKWDRKQEWVNEKKALEEWGDVRAYDADDLELWLEQETAVQLWFAELLGKPVQSMKTVERYWADWNRDVVPEVTQSAVLSSRQKERDYLLKLIKNKQNGGTIVVHADSVDEAVAFSCAVLMTSEGLERSQAVVINNTTAWSSIVASSNIKLAIASDNSVAEGVPFQDGLVLISPFANGDSEAHFPGHRHIDVDPDVVLQRTFPEDFRNSLEEMGIDHGDAQRLTLQCGRSWSVYRRLKNKNPALRQPNWSDKQFSSVLTTIALVGAFAENNDADLEFVVEVSGQSYDDFLKQAELLLKMDDAPIARINGVIKAKSLLEVFVLNEKGIGEEMFDRFVTCCEGILGQPDPYFELEKEERWMANIHGKVRPQSGALIHSLADALPRISVLSTSDERRWKIDQLIQRLLKDATVSRWLALSPIMQELAEGSPSEFLKALETDLAKPEPQVFSLFSESSSVGMGGGFVHANLLWALETLAWAPNRILRVSRVLAELKRAPIGDNWGNNPSSSLLNIYRGWKPQTSATVEMRNKAMTTLSDTNPDAAFDLSMGILHRGHDMASPSSRPSWRDDDAGCPETVTNIEYHDVQIHAANLAFDLSESDASRAIELFDRYDIFDNAYRERVLKVIRAALESGGNDDIRAIRKSLRHKLHWEYNYGGKKREGLNKKHLSAIQKCYDDSEPDDPIERYQWLFENHYCELPEKDGKKSSEEGQERLKTLRIAALAGVFDKLGLEGIEQLAHESGSYCCMGPVLQDVTFITEKEKIEWMAPRFGSGDAPEFMCEWLRSRNDEESAKLLKALIMHGEANLKWTETEILRLLQVARCDPITWKLVDALSRENQNKYWSDLNSLPFWLSGHARKAGVKNLLAFENPAAVLRSLRHREEEFNGEEIADILERNFASSDNALKDIQLHDIQDFISIMETCDRLERQRLLRLEFQLVSAFGQFVAESTSELHRELIENPDQLLFVISNAYKNDNRDKEKSSEADTRLAEVCGQILMYAKITPGLQRDGTFSEEKFREFVTHLKKRSAEEGYVKGMQHVLGELLAYAPETDKGDWPPQCVCEVLDVQENDTLRSSFQIGIYNKRGVTCRLPYDGGEQEREIAKRYDGYAERCQIEYPLASETLTGIADSYRRDATRHDRDAESSKERF